MSNLNEIIGVEDNVPFKVYQDGEYLGMAVLNNGHLYSIYGFSLESVEIEIIVGGANYTYVICPDA